MCLTFDRLFSGTTSNCRKFSQIETSTYTKFNNSRVPIANWRILRSVALSCVPQAAGRSNTERSGQDPERKLHQRPLWLRRMDHTLQKIPHGNDHYLERIPVRFAATLFLGATSARAIEWKDDSEPTDPGKPGEGLLRTECRDGKFQTQQAHRF